MRIEVYNGNNNTTWSVYVRSNSIPGWMWNVPVGTTAKFDVPPGQYYVLINSNANIQEVHNSAKSIPVSTDTYVQIYRQNGSVLASNNPVGVTKELRDPLAAFSVGVTLAAFCMVLAFNLRMFRRVTTVSVSD